MIDVINNGYEKQLYTQCDSCLSDLSFKVSDTRINGVEQIKTIMCPVCNNTIFLPFLSECEVNKNE